MSKKSLLAGTVIIVLVIAFIVYKNNRLYPHTLMVSGTDGFAVAPSVPTAMTEPGMIGVAQDSLAVMEDAMDQVVFQDKEGMMMGGDEAIPLEEGERLIVKNGMLSMVVDDVAASIDRIKEYIEGKGGFVVMSSVSKQGVVPLGTVTVRIPVESFDEGFAELQTYGDVEERRTNGQDITEEYVDLEAQLKNLRATEAQFLSILNRATKIEDVLNVQRELTWVRERIERIEGRMKYLRESADLSSITVHLSTNPSALPVIDDEDRWRPLGVARDAARSLVDFGQTIVDGIIWFAVYIPVWILILLAGWGASRMWKKYRA